MTSQFFPHFRAIDMYQISQAKKVFKKTRYNSKLWLFSAFFGPFRHFYYQIWSFRYKIWCFWPISIYKTLYLKTVFENELKGPYWPLWNVLASFFVQPLFSVLIFHIGGFHLYLLVFPFLYQFYSRIEALVSSSFAND